MADNVNITPGDGAIIAADDVGGVKVQRVKVQTGADGVAADAGHAANPFYDLSGLALGDSGRKTSTSVGTAVALATTTPAKFVRVTALLTNTAQVNVGGASALAVAGSTAGDPLLPGDSTTFVVTNLTQIYLDVRVSGEGVSHTYWT